MRATLSWTDCKVIIRAEVARAGRIPGHDVDDMRQEAAVAAARALSSVDESRAPRAYVRTSVRNALIKLRRAAMAAKRIPHDDWGRPLPIAGGDSLLGIKRDESDPEVRSQARELIRALRDDLDEHDWSMLVSAFTDSDFHAAVRERGRSELRLVAAHARQILNRIITRTTGDISMTNTAIASPPPDLIPECHADGKEPQGYDPGEPECLLCPDKFSCLPRGIKSGLLQIRIDADLEVAAVTGGHLSQADAIGRMKRRQDVIKSGAEVPEELGVTWPGLVPESEEAPQETQEPSEESDDPEEGSEPEAAEEPSEEPQEPASEAEEVEPEAAEEAAEEVEPEAAEEVEPEAAEEVEGRPRLHLGKGRYRDAPLPKMIPEEKMIKALSRVRIGQSAELGYGMKIERRMRSGEVVSVLISPNGFIWNGLTFGSHSSALMWALGRYVSGNDWLHLRQPSVRLIGADGNEISKL